MTGRWADNQNDTRMRVRTKIKKDKLKKKKNSFCKWTCRREIVIGKGNDYECMIYATTLVEGSQACKISDFNFANISERGSN